MGAGVLVLGRSGAGKSASLRNFAADEVGVLNVMAKPMPFRSSLQTMERPNYDSIKRCILSGRRRAWVVDDAGYLLSNENFARAQESGYTKYVEMAQKFADMVNAIGDAPRDTITYVVMHPELDALGREKPRTIGKMLDEKYCIEGAFSVILDCCVVDGRHVFVTESDGTNLAKAPMDCLPPVMDNDLKAVDTALRECWGLKPIVDEAPEGGGSK